MSYCQKTLRRAGQMISSPATRDMAQRFMREGSLRISSTLATQSLGKFPDLSVVNFEAHSMRVSGTKAERASVLNFFPIKVNPETQFLVKPEIFSKLSEFSLTYPSDSSKLSSVVLKTAQPKIQQPLDAVMTKISHTDRAKECLRSLKGRELPFVQDSKRHMAFNAYVYNPSTKELLFFENAKTLRQPDSSDLYASYLKEIIPQIPKQDLEGKENVRFNVAHLRRTPVEGFQRREEDFHRDNVNNRREMEAPSMMVSYIEGPHLATSVRYGEKGGPEAAFVSTQEASIYFPQQVKEQSADGEKWTRVYHKGESPSGKESREILAISMQVHLR